MSFRTYAAWLGLGFAALGCASADATDASSETNAASEPTATVDSALVATADDAWFYGGPLPALESPVAIVSLEGHTVRVTGTLPASVDMPPLPHLRTRADGAKLRVDLVYPIATARAGKSNASPATYAVTRVKPYRPDGPAYTIEEGEHDVPWGGFPFIAYNGGIGLHGPITSKDNKAPGTVDVWFLERGPVSGGCNRMMGEHAVELAHVLGMSMRKVYAPNRDYGPEGAPKVKVVEGYDVLDGKYVDVDYPTATGAVRPATLHGRENVTMFGSWLASETPDGRDFPPDMKWEGGVNGDPYVFAEHLRRNMVCSMPREVLPKLARLASYYDGRELPASLCAKKSCILHAFETGRDASICQL